MCNIPKDCVNCIYHTSCDSAYNMDGCNYCGLLQEDNVSMIHRIKSFFGKFFK